MQVVWQLLLITQSYVCLLRNPELLNVTGIVASGPDPIQFSRTGEVVPGGYVLHLVVEGKSLGLSESIGTYVPLPQG